MVWSHTTGCSWAVGDTIRARRNMKDKQGNTVLTVGELRKAIKGLRDDKVVHVTAAGAGGYSPLVRISDSWGKAFVLVMED